MSILLDGVRCSFDPTQEEQWEKVFQKLPKVVLERLLGTGHGLSVLTMGMEGVQPQERASLMRLTWLTDEQVAQVQDELLYREIRDNRGLQVLDCDDQEDGLIPERGQTIFFFLKRSTDSQKVGGSFVMVGGPSLKKDEKTVSSYRTCSFGKNKERIYFVGVSRRREDNGGSSSGAPCGYSRLVL